jgi:prophage antirepressor-like protein
MDENNIQLFENKRIRTAWDVDRQEWFLSVADVVEVLTDSADVKQYIKKMRSRDPELNARWGTICTLTEMTAADGKKYRTTAANAEGIFRIIQSIPSPKAEPFKLWLARVGSERIEETIDPEITIDRALDTYLKKGYTREWINQRLQAIQVRKELTDEWDNRGVRKGVEYAILTDEITKAWSGMNTRQYKNLKTLKKENLRDNMSTMELVLNMLAEATTTTLSRKQEPQTLTENINVARQGGGIAGDARKAIEAAAGEPVITSQSAVQFNTLLTDMIEDVAEKSGEEKGKNKK